MSDERIEKAIFKQLNYPRDDFTPHTWCVSEWYVEDFTITVTGVLPVRPKKNEEWTLVGKWREHPKYGRQLMLAHIYQKRDMNSLEGVKEHLGYIMPERLFNNLFETYPDPTRIFNGPIEDAIEALSKVKGLGKKKAEDLYNKFFDSFNRGDGYLQLKKLGLTDKAIKSLRRMHYDYASAYESVKNDPYGTLTRIPGIGFKRADEIAFELGITEKSHKRIAGCMMYILRTAAQEGRSWLTKNQLLQDLYIEFGGKSKVYKEYEDGSNNFAKALNWLKKRQLVGEDTGPNGERRVYPLRYRNLEEAVAEELKRIQSGECAYEVTPEEIEERLAEKEKEQGWKFTKDQRDGIQLAIDNQVCLITGGAGTGKSTLVSGLLAALKGIYFEQTALSGKAAARLQNVTGQEGMTIHRLLGLSPGGPPTFCKGSPLYSQMVILDEISLVGGELFLNLLEAIPTGCKLIILGDMNQLEAIGSMNIAHDLYESPTIPTIKLTEILRQAQDSGIVTVANDVRQMKNPFPETFKGQKTIGKLQDMHVHMIEKAASQDFERLFQNEYMRWFNSPEVNGDSMAIHVLAPMRERGKVCVQVLNDVIQELVNPNGLNDPCTLDVMTNGHQWALAIGDKVMCTRNIYGMVKYGPEEEVVEELSAVFNGWTGKVIDITGQHAIIYFFEGQGYYKFTFDMIPKYLSLGYASTVHKFQGSSAPVILGVVDSTTPPQMLTKELMYTLITRAEKQCVLLTQYGAFVKSTKNSAVSQKQTFLEELLNKEDVNDDRLETRTNILEDSRQAIEAQRTQRAS